MNNLIINHQLESISSTNSLTTGTVNFSGLSGGILLPSGGTASRPTPAAGIFRYNTDSNKLEFTNGTSWTTIGTGILTNIVAGTGLTGGTITSGGTIGVQTNGISNALLAQRNSTTLMGNPTGATATTQDIILGTGLSFSGTSLAMGTTGVTAGTFQDSTVTVDALGRVSAISTGRIRLQSNLTLYVSPSGNDSNPGTIGSPFLTIQKAIDTISLLYDLAGWDVIIQLADGTYTTQTTVNGAFVGATALTSALGGPSAGVYIQGNIGTPTNVHLSMGTTSAIVSQGNNSLITIKGVKISTPQLGAAGLLALEGGVILFENVVFGTSGGSHIQAQFQAGVISLDSYTIAGNAAQHFAVAQNSYILSQFGSVTVSGTPTFSSTFASASSNSTITSSVTYSGSAIGIRYNTSQNAVIDTPTGSATYFPGNSAGVATTGGIYA